MRRYLDKPVDRVLLDTLCAVALSAPSKSDLQQADIVVVTDKAQRAVLDELAPGNPWMKAAPAILVFCGNNRRQRLAFDWRKRPYVNDHLDPFFNAAVDAAIVLATFVAAADRVGLGTCPISTLRNKAAEVSKLLGLPDHVFPARKDSRFGVSLAQPMYLENWEAGFAALGGEGDLGGWLGALYGAPAPKAMQFESYLHEAGLPAPERRGREDLSWWMLAVALDEIAPAKEPAPASALLEYQGLAVLRSGDRYASLECDRRS